MATQGLIIAGLSSGSGKTTVTLGLIRALCRQKTDISAAKCGPDYIDCGFLAAASGRTAITLDEFAMPDEMLRTLACGAEGETVIVEGVMGLFDGTHAGRGSTAALAAKLKLGVILVIDTRHQAQTAAAIAAGLAGELPDGATLAGVILNHIASPRHEQLIKQALSARSITCFGALPSAAEVTVPSRHLGLVQSSDLAAEGRLDTIIEATADLVATHIDCVGVLAAATPLHPALPGSPDFARQAALNPPAQHIAMAHDAAFGFHYTHMLGSWRDAGAQISVFSPLNDDVPAPDAEFIFLPGGYPELHLPSLTNATSCIDALVSASHKNIPIYGECGGFMMLGRQIIDADGTAFPVAGLLPLETSFAARRLHLGYRVLHPLHRLDWLGAAPINAHEFHHTTALAAEGDALFSATDAAGTELGDIGLIRGSVAGSYAHIIA